MAGVESSTSWTVYDATKLSAREIYGVVLSDLGAARPDIVGLSADLAKSTQIGAFGERFPDRFFNFGIAEQNMFGAAAGLAKMGLTPFVSTFSAFASMRACEFLRTDVCYQNLNVKVIATHGGTSFGSAGTTHHATEDLSIVRAFANLTVIVPADGLRRPRPSRSASTSPGRSTSASAAASSPRSTTARTRPSRSARPWRCAPARTSPSSPAAPRSSTPSRRRRCSRRTTA
ncbi:MAG TPA: hypothetical protein PKV69_01050 [Candidatus Hydrogenedentes bacterium]|nr:hypothetical protein [Candidatus Hydrogenedentota bacterium]